MDNMACNKMHPTVRKAKKKQVKDELDRLKQAEKKKRRLEKALATSAAICSELEKKKQRKKEEQQKLDEEGAAIAEAVALNVLLGEDSDDSCKIMLKEDEGFNYWDCAGNIDLFLGRRGFPHQDSTKRSFERIGWMSNAYGSGYKYGGFSNSDWPFSYSPFERAIPGPCSENVGWGTNEFSAGLLAAQAVSSLQISDDEAIVFNGMMRG